MRYKILKFMSKHPLLIITMVIVLIDILLMCYSGILHEIGKMILVFVSLFGGCIVLAKWAAGDFNDKRCFKKFIKNEKYERMYRNNEKILKEIYTDKIERVLEENTLLNDSHVQNIAEIVNLNGLSRWYNYLIKYPLEFRKSKNKEILQKIYQATENVHKLYDSRDYESYEKMHKNARVVFNDIKRICDTAEKMIDSGDIQSIFEEENNDNINAKQSTEYLIIFVNSILEKNDEFAETVQKLEKIKELIPEEEISAKFRIVLENMIICSEKFETSNDEIYQSEFRQLIIQLNEYLDKILMGEKEATTMEDVATVRALRDFIS